SASSCPPASSGGATATSSLPTGPAPNPCSPASAPSCNPATASTTHGRPRSPVSTAPDSLATYTVPPRRGLSTGGLLPSGAAAGEEESHPGRVQIPGRAI